MSVTVQQQSSKCPASPASVYVVALCTRRGQRATQPTAYTSWCDACLCVQVAASERLAEVWVQLAAELGASPEELSAVRINSGNTLGTAPQPPLLA